MKSLALVAGAATALVLPTGAAYAAPAPDCPPAAVGGQYPGSGCTAAVSDSSVYPGETITVSGDGFASGTPYTITLHSTPVVLASGTTSGSTITRSVTIPENTAPGGHTITIDGTDATGGPRELNASITVSAANGGGGNGGGGNNGGGHGKGHHHGGGNSGNGNGNNSGANRSGATIAGTSATTGAETAGMPNTGASSSTLPLLAGGAGLVIVGAGFVAYSRKRRSPNASA